MRVRFIVPPTMEQGNCVLIGTSNHSETALENALWDYNSMRAHDDLGPTDSLPEDTKAEILEDDQTPVDPGLKWAIDNFEAYVRRLEAIGE